MPLWSEASQALGPSAALRIRTLRQRNRDCRWGAARWHPRIHRDGVSMIQGGAVSLVTAIAIFLSNIPAELSSSAGMKKAGRSALYVFGVWGVIAVVSGIASVVGYAIFSGLGDDVIAATTAIAAGAILSMFADTMMPEAFEATHTLAGLITVLGFLCAFVISKLG